MRRLAPMLVTWLVAGFVVVGLLLGSVGCGVDGYVRDTEITHWHDEETFILVYTRERTLGNIAAPFRPEGETVHVKVCTIDDDNDVTCRHQRRLTNMLNPETVDEGDLADPWRP